MRSHTGYYRAGYSEEDRGFVTACWISNAAPSRKGYAQFTTSKKNMRAHRWYYEQARGPIPEGMTLDHLCRQRLCVNPDHLQPVTVAENCRRGRGAKLGWSGVAAAQIASMSTTLSQEAIGDMLGVTQGAISRAVRGKSWGSL